MKFLGQRNDVVGKHLRRGLVQQETLRRDRDANAHGVRLSQDFSNDRVLDFDVTEDVDSMLEASRGQSSGRLARKLSQLDLVRYLDPDAFESEFPWVDRLSGPTLSLAAISLNPANGYRLVTPRR